MKKKSRVFSNIYMWIILAFLYLPIFYVVFFSFNSTKSLSHFTGFSTRWYEAMFNNRSIMEAIMTTVIVAVIATAVSTLVGTVTAIGLTKNRKVVKELINTTNNLPILNPDIVTAIGLMLFFTSLRIKTGFWTMLLAHIAFCIPYVMLSVLPHLRRMDSNMAEAAMDLGCTPWQAIWKVIIPQIKGGIIAGALVAFSMSFDDFVISLFTTGPGISNISIYVYSNVKRVNPTINALSAIIVYVITAVLIIMNVVPIFREKAKAKRLAKLEKAEQEAKVSHKKPKDKKPVNKKMIYIPVAAALVVALVTVLFFNNRKPDAKQMYGCNVLNVYNAGEYIGEDTLSNFEEKYNARVNYDTFDSNETMYTKLLGGSSYDVLVPSDYMIERLIGEEMLQPLDQKILTNLKDLDPAVTDMRDQFDPNGTYSVPYFWGTVGLVYDKTQVSEEDIKSEGWEILKDQKYKNNFYFYDSQRDGFMIAFKALGYSMNTDNEEEIMAAYNWLQEMNATMEPAYVTDEVIDSMVNGEKAIAVVYSGDAAYILSENENMAWYEPDQGTNKWVDGMVIPANAECSGLANEFINYMIDYDVQNGNTATVGYTPTRKDSADFMRSEDGDYYENAAFSPRENGAKDEVFHYNEKLTKKLSDLWNKVKVNG